MSKSPAYPNPEPERPVCRRLEHVRHQKGVRSKRQFWLRLGVEHPTGELSKGAVVRWEDREGEDREVSYAAVKLYHFDREPPAWYLARVSDVFEVNLLWLVTGSGPMDRTHEHILAELEGAEAEQEARRAKYGFDEDELHALAEKHLSEQERQMARDAGIVDDPLLQVPAVRESFRMAWTRLAHACPGPELTPDQLNAIGRDLLRHLRAPLNAWGFAHDLPSDFRKYEDYALPMLHALAQAIAQPGRGDPIAKLGPARGRAAPRSLSRRQPERVEPAPEEEETHVEEEAKEVLE